MFSLMAFEAMFLLYAEGLEGVVVSARVDRPAGGDQPHLAVAGHSGRGTCRRVDDLDDRDAPP